MNIPLAPNVNHPVELVRPLGDFILVKRLPDCDEVNSLIIRPGMCMNASGKWVRSDDCELRLGEVIAVGPGDEIPNGNVLSSGTGSMIAVTKLLPMHVKVGDTVLYPRVPANDVRIDGQEYTFLREEQHVLAVIE